MAIEKFCSRHSVAIEKFCPRPFVALEKLCPITSLALAEFCSRPSLAIDRFYNSGRLEDNPFLDLFKAPLSQLQVNEPCLFPNLLS